MESRVLTSGATAIRGGLPLLRKPAAVMKFTAAGSCSVSSSSNDFPAAAATGKPVGPLIAGPNLIWGRQLRPPILLESSPKRESIKPCFTAASSPAEGSDSSGEAKLGFFNKATLTTGFFFFTWYFLNVIFNILNKKIYNYFPYPYFVSVIHLAVGVVYCLISWIVGLPKRAPIDSTQLKLLTPVAFCHALGHVTSNVSFAAVAVSFTHTIKALEPFFNAAASQFILGQQIPLALWLSLAPVVLG